MLIGYMAILFIGVLIIVKLVFDAEKSNQIVDQSEHFTQEKQQRNDHLRANRKEYSMILSNIDFVPGKSIVEHYGIVQGSTVRAKNVGVDFMASCQNLFGGELQGYSQLLEESRKEAVDRMIGQAMQLGANAIVSVRFGTSTITQGASEILAYGTAVKVQ